MSERERIPRLGDFPGDQIYRRNASVMFHALARSEALIYDLPLRAPVPTITLEDDLSVTFDWDYAHMGCQLSVTIDYEGRLAWVCSIERDGRQHREQGKSSPGDYSDVNRLARLLVRALPDE